MKTKTSILLILVGIIFVGTPMVQGQTRFPIHAKLSLNQRVFEPPTTTISLQELKFNGLRSHSLGLGLGLEFGLNELDKTPTNWMITTSMNLFSVPLRYQATLPKDIHGFDRDVSWEFNRYSSGFEAVVGIIRESKLNDVWDIRLGIGANIQDMYFNSNKLEHSVTVIRDGQINSEQVFGIEFDPFFGFGNPGSTREKQDLRFNTVYSVGVCADLNNNSQFVAELKVCHSGQNVIQPLNFLFGDTGEFVYKKSYVGIDLAYRFSMNSRLSSGVK